MSNAKSFCNAIKTTLTDKAKKAVGYMQDTVEKRIRESIDEYYRDYSPKQYIRTNTLANSLTVSGVQEKGNHIEANVMIMDSMGYNTGSPWWSVGDTVKASDAHTHGYYKAGSGVSIWSDPINSMLMNEAFLWQLAFVKAGLK